jgi:phosphate transport system substrate-binding protein
MLSLAVAAAALGAAPALAQGKVEVDPSLPSYEAVAEVEGTIKSVGSDSMNNLMKYWAEGFREFYPNVTIEVEGKGSATAPPALVEGTAHFGPMSRPMKPEEIDSFEAKFGYKPTEIATSIDMLAVFVNKDNPIKSLSLPQVDAIFSKTRKLGGTKDLKTWGDAGLTDAAWAKKPIGLYGRNSASGTYGFFKEHVLGKGDFKDTVKEQPGTSTVVQGVAKDDFGIGYGGIGYLTADVRAVPLAPKDGEDAVAPEPEYGYSGEYPLSRYLYLYVNKNPNEELDPLRREFARYVLSKQGQEVVVKDGYLPITAPVAAEILKALDIDVEIASAGN